MLGLITQAKSLRPWMQLNYGTQVSVAAIALQLPLRSNESCLMAQEPPLPCEELKAAVSITRRAKRLSSRIPRMTKTRVESDNGRVSLPKPMTAEEEVKKSDDLALAPKAPPVGKKSNLPTLIAGVGTKRKAANVVKHVKSTTFEAKATTLIETTKKECRGKALNGAKPNAAGPPGAVADEKVTPSVPVVRSTRTSRCRIKLAHQHSLSTNGNAAASPAAVAVSAAHTAKKVGSNPCTHPEMHCEHARYYMMDRKYLTEPFIRLCPSLGKCVQTRVVEKSFNQIWCFLCSDLIEINVPSQLIMHYSPLMRDRQMNTHLAFSQPIQLETITSHTMNRLITWMKHHRQDDLIRLHKKVPSVANARSKNCSWDENFLGNDIDSVLHMLLASNCLGIYPLVEHTMLYFIELIEQRNNIEHICMKHISKTLTKIQNIHPMSSEKFELIRPDAYNADGFVTPKLDND